MLTEQSETVVNAGGDATYVIPLEYNRIFELISVKSPDKDVSVTEDREFDTPVALKYEVREQVEIL